MRHWNNLERIDANFRLLQSANTSIPIREIFINERTRKPPLIYAVAVFFRRALPHVTPYVATLFSLTIYHVIFVFGCYWLFRTALPRAWALIGVFFQVISFHLVFAGSAFSIGLAYTSFSVFALALLLNRPVFLRTRDTILFAIVSTLGVMTYYFFWVFLLFLIPAYCVTERVNLRKHLQIIPLQFLLFLLIVVALSSPLYLDSERIMEYSRTFHERFLADQAVASVGPEGGVRLFESIKVFLGQIINYGVNLVVFGLWPPLICLPIFFIKTHQRIRRSLLAFVGIMVVGFILFFSLLQDTFLEYFMPLLPLIQMIMLIRLYHMTKMVRTVFALVIVAVSSAILFVGFLVEPRLSQKNVHLALQPVVTLCREKQTPCKVLWSTCQINNDFFYSRGGQFDPKTPWTFDFFKQKARAKDLDFIVFIGPPFAKIRAINQTCRDSFQHPLRMTGREKPRLFLYDQEVTDHFVQLSKMPDSRLSRLELRVFANTHPPASPPEPSP